MKWDEFAQEIYQPETRQECEDISCYTCRYWERGFCPIFEEEE